MIRETRVVQLSKSLCVGNCSVHSDFCDLIKQVTEHVRNDVMREQLFDDENGALYKTLYHDTEIQYFVHKNGDIEIRLASGTKTRDRKKYMLDNRNIIIDKSCDIIIKNNEITNVYVTDLTNRVKQENSGGCKKVIHKIGFQITYDNKFEKIAESVKKKGLLSDRDNVRPSGILSSDIYQEINVSGIGNFCDSNKKIKTSYYEKKLYEIENGRDTEASTKDKTLLILNEFLERIVEKHILHGDIKYRNVMIDSNHKIYLMDASCKTDKMCTTTFDTKFCSDSQEVYDTYELYKYLRDLIGLSTVIFQLGCNNKELSRKECVARMNKKGILYIEHLYNQYYDKVGTDIYKKKILEFCMIVFCAGHYGKFPMFDKFPQSYNDFLSVTKEVIGEEENKIEAKECTYIEYKAEIIVDIYGKNVYGNSDFDKKMKEAINELEIIALIDEYNKTIDEVQKVYDEISRNCEKFLHERSVLEDDAVWKNLVCWKNVKCRDEKGRIIRDKNGNPTWDRKRVIKEYVEPVETKKYLVFRKILNGVPKIPEKIDIESFKMTEVNLDTLKTVSDTLIRIGTSIRKNIRKLSQEDKQVLGEHRNWFNRIIGFILGRFWKTSSLVSIEKCSRMMDDAEHEKRYNEMARKNAPIQEICNEMPSGVGQRLDPLSNIYNKIGSRIK